MGEVTKIAWCHHTFNPWWGCVKIAAECQRCYAESFARRTGHAVWGLTADRRFFGAKHWAEPIAWHAAAVAAGERRRVFCASMADVFEDRPDLDAPRARLWDLIGQTPQLDWLLLTKRPENARRLVPAEWRAGWPDNVWFGTTIGHPDRLDAITYLRDVPAAVRFISGEPLLAGMNFHADTEIGYINALAGLAPGEVSEVGSPKIDWLILGGESGPGARPLHAAWLRTAIAAARDAGAAVFVKQMGAQFFDDAGRLVKLRHPKGENPDEWAPEFQIREFPR